MSSGVALRTRAAVAVAIAAQSLQHAEVTMPPRSSPRRPKHRLKRLLPSGDNNNCRGNNDNRSPEIVTDGAVVIVASRAASTGRPVECQNSLPPRFRYGYANKFDRRRARASKIYYIDEEAALGVAESLVRAFGGVFNSSRCQQCHRSVRQSSVTLV